MKGKRLISKLLAVAFVLSIMTPMVHIKAAEKSGVFKDTLQGIQRAEFKAKPFVAKPLIVLMECPDYKHEDLDSREPKRVNKFKGADTTKEFYQKMFFGDDTYDGNGKPYVTTKKFFKEQSGGSYIFDGKVFGWYMAKHDLAYYGHDANDKDLDFDEGLELVKEAIENVANDPSVDLSEFDVEDKNDYDHDGNYYEPDGIIDSIIVIHPGLGENQYNGGSLNGEPAIWPYRDKATNYTVDNKPYSVKDSKGKTYGIEDFIVCEQDLPVDLLSHEYGHVLGLPDLYSTSGQPPVQYWSIMGGSYAGDPRGTLQNTYGAFCREFLQKKFENMKVESKWANGRTINFNDIKDEGIDIVLDQASLKGSNSDMLRVSLPEKTTQVADMIQGKYAYFSGNTNNLRNSMITTLDLKAKKKAELTFKTWYDIDEEYDYASVQVKVEGSNKWIPIKGNITTDKSPNDDTPKDLTDRNPGHGITGKSEKKWIDAKFDLSKFAGKKIQLKFYFWTDGNGPKEGIYIDNIKVVADGKVILSADAEKDGVFKLDGFTRSNGVQKSNHYYLVEWRNSKNGILDNGLDLVQKFRPCIKYTPGLVVWYVNERFIDESGKPDQDVTEHPGECAVGVVDADTIPVRITPTGKEEKIDNGKSQMHDAAFSLWESQEINDYVKSDYDDCTIKDDHSFMNPLFDDSQDYSCPEKPDAGLKIDNLGLKIFITDESKDRSTVKIHVSRDGVKNPTIQDASLIKGIKVNGKNIELTTDKEYAQKAYITYMSGNKKGEVVLTYKDGKYVGELNFLDNKGNWQISSIILHDKEDNAKAIYNSKLYKVFGADLSAGDIK